MSTIFQTLSEEQFQIIDEMVEEQKMAMLAGNSLPESTVTFYGGAMISKEDKDYLFVKNLAKEFAARGWGVVSGGGPGIMEASLLGAKEAGGTTVAYRIDIKNEKPTVLADIDILFKHFSIRKRALRQSDALVYAPGGFGTLDELMENLTLIKTHKYPEKPIFLLNRQFWSGYIQWFEKILIAERKVVSQDATKLFKMVDTVGEVIESLYGKS